jgi:cytochrome c oxidase assembly protein subunit 15
MDTPELVNWEPIARLVLLGLVLAAGPLVWVWARHRGATPTRRLQALTLLTLFLTFDLILFGAFTRLTDSGLGCPDWPGCYGSASPIGAHQEIHAAQSALPDGPVTFGKAWIEMIHRYLATGVGVLITVLALASGWQWRRDRAQGIRSEVSPGWAAVTLVWVCLQGAFGALTVTLKLYPAIVTAHLLGGLALLALLASMGWPALRASVAVSAGLRRGLWLVGVLVVAQIALGGWVSTNYAVLACSDFPTCQGVWWPRMDFEQGFAILRPLGVGPDGGWLPFEALVAIHMAHRLGALVLLSALAWLAWRLNREPALRRLGWGVAGVALWQLLTGLSNVVLGWPLLAAVGHTGGAAALVLLMTLLLVRTRAHDPSRQLEAASHPGSAASGASAAPARPLASRIGS